MTQQTKPFIVANVREIIDGWEHFDPEGYTFSKMVEKMNEVAEQFYKPKTDNMTQQTMTKEQWKYSEHTHALADTGDYEGYVQFTNGKDILQSCGDEMEEEQLKQFCELLNLMPDLWSHKCDALEFENSQLKQEVAKERDKAKKLVEALKGLMLFSEDDGLIVNGFRSKEFVLQLNNH